MPNQVILKHPNWFRLIKSAETIDIKVDKFVFEIEFTKHVLARIEKNPAIQQKLWDAASKEWKKLLKDLDAIVASEEKVLKTAQQKHTPAMFENVKKGTISRTKKKLDRRMETVQKEMSAAVMKEWDKARKQHNLGTNFKIKTAFKAVGRILAIGSSVASLVVTGGTNVIAYVTIARSISTTVMELKKLCKDLDAQGAQLAKDVEDIGKSIEKSPSFNDLKDAGNVIAFSILGGSVIKSHAAATKTTIKYKARVAMLQQRHLKLCKDIVNMMKKVSKEKSKVDRASQAKIKRLEDKLDALLGKAHVLGARFEKNFALAEKLEKDLKDMKSMKAITAAKVSMTTGAYAANITKAAVGILLVDATSATQAVIDIATDIAKDAA